MLSSCAYSSRGINLNNAQVEIHLSIFFSMTKPGLNKHRKDQRVQKQTCNICDISCRRLCLSRLSRESVFCGWTYVMRHELSTEQTS